MCHWPSNSGCTRSSTSPRSPATLLEQLVDLGHLGRKTEMGLRAY
ncbi:hypothetical protein ACIQRC_33225 [Streptomyces californicus]